jgi:hypothetical protein
MFPMLCDSYRLAASSPSRACSQVVSVLYYFAALSLLFHHLVTCNEPTCVSPHALFGVYFHTCPQQPSTLTKTKLKTVSPEADSHCFVHVIFLDWSYAFTSRLGTLNVCWSTEESAGGLGPSANERHSSWYVTCLPSMLTQQYILIN